MSLFTQKITLFLILGLLIIGLGIPYAIYASRRDVTGMMTGFLIVAVLITIAFIVLDRLAIRYVSPGWVSGIELVILVVAGVYYANTSRTLTLDLSKNPSPYFVIIWTKDLPKTPAPESHFLFNKIVTVPEGTSAQLNQNMFSITTLTPPPHWEGQYSLGIELTHPRFKSAYFYGPEAYHGKPAEVDSLLREIVARQ